jgi:hypothetical protein
MSQDVGGRDVSIGDALRRQLEDPGDHEAGLIDEYLSLTPDERLQRLTSWVAFVASARPIEGPAKGGRT